MSNTTQGLTPEIVIAEIGYPVFVRSLFNRSGDHPKDFAHAILGIATELNELHRATDAVNRDEEFGDLGFYAQAVVNLVDEVLGVDSTDEYITGLALNRVDEMFEMQAQTEGHTHWDVIEDATTELLDAAKRWVGYGREPDFVKVLAGTGGVLLYAAGLYGLSEDDFKRIELRNVAKLLERYKGLTFNADLAVNRDTVAERQVLERNAA